MTEYSKDELRHPVDLEKKAKVDEALARVTRNLLSQAGIGSLWVNENAQLCGSMNSQAGYPHTLYLYDIRLNIVKDEKSGKEAIVINSGETHVVYDDGKVI
ncbi:hypothetical protein A2803_01885 [Candidatus Woesebacteria bacterium RIFCSPHIGHO2_01_FULL_44_21]|uniref:Uncharacterized protein n=1 Tax=Candidatus Woesebacteria bacterium RIFCSPHIGHO2_01_FULL_44_21 TaxID=1802503 RepID=A0A1F7YXL7_9BACT|nr:MAG: hypothetical protein A2803_01885 [Candidatus Woesebacteria bacterium RIFCSPHIGHO2_01_FULL_44_21]OGM69622.1 MAG: hypothetical protein A2897_03400 [Candidatus Woesebacteria bacterium RIFCSPLOWO2_01_FULL_44_24b]